MKKQEYLLKTNYRQNRFFYFIIYIIYKDIDNILRGIV